MRPARRLGRGRRKASSFDGDALVFQSSLWLLGLLVVLVLWAATSAAAFEAPAVRSPYLGEFCIEPATDGDLVACYWLDPMELLADEAQFLEGRAVMFKVMCRVSGGVTGTREQLLKNRGGDIVFATREEAEAEAAEMMKRMNHAYSVADFKYWAVEEGEL